MEKTTFKESKDGIYSATVGKEDFALFEIDLEPQLEENIKDWKKICKKNKTQFALKIEADAENVIYCGKNDEQDGDSNIWLNKDGSWFNIILKPCFCGRPFTEEELKHIILELREHTFYASKTIKAYHEEKLFYQEEGLPKEDRTYKRLTEVINKIFNTFDINTCVRKSNFLAQMYAETKYYTDTKENGYNLSYDPYRGRGFIQLTHKGDQDKRTGNATSYLGYEKYSGYDVITNPDLVSNSLDLSADSGGWFWKYGVRKLDGSLIDLNTICSDTEDSVKEVTRLIKGSTSNYKIRYSYFVELLKIFDYEDCYNNN